MKLFKNIIALFLIVLAACTSKDKQQTKFGRVNQFEDKNVVITDMAHKGTFYKEFESNGKLEALGQSELKFELDATIKAVHIKNGQRVKKGQLLVALDAVKQQHAYKRSKRQLEKCRLSLEDQLISMGYDLKDSANIPANVMKVALIRTGYSDVLSEMEMSSIQYQKTEVRAPFDGLVADVELKPNNKSSRYKQCCTLIDDSAFEIHFPLLESEAFALAPGKAVAVISLVNNKDTIMGQLTAINPKVNEAGMVSATALIPNVQRNLVDGMNVKVIVRDAIHNQLIIPKSAITLRQERTVAFVCKNDTAHWRYVDVVHENSRYCTIKGNKIKAGEEVITDGNFNLAHLVPVVKMND